METESPTTEPEPDSRPADPADPDPARPADPTPDKNAPHEPMDPVNPGAPDPVAWPRDGEIAAKMKKPGLHRLRIPS